MDPTFVEEKSLKSLEDYAVLSTTDIIVLETMKNFQERAIKIGIMKEDMNERANTIIWDIKRLIEHYEIQMESTLELTGKFDHKKVIEDLKKKKRAKEKAENKNGE